MAVRLFRVLVLAFVFSVSSVFLHADDDTASDILGSQDLGSLPPVPVKVSHAVADESLTFDNSQTSGDAPAKSDEKSDDKQANSSGD